MSWKRTQTLTLLLFLCLSLLVTAASAAVVQVGDTNVPIGGTGTFDIYLDSAPNGLAGYCMTVFVGNPDDAQIVGVTYGDFPIHETFGVPSGRVTLKGSNFDEDFKAGASHILLATVTVRGDSVGLVPLEAEVLQMDALGGGEIATSVESGVATVGNYEPPEASFTMDPDHGPAPLTVSFTDTSSFTDDLESWNWQFGDGATSTEQNPHHTYAAMGHYDVTLTVTDDSAQSDSETMTEAIDVFGPAPVAEFTATNTEGFPPLTVTFTDASTGSDDIESWVWNFGDGATSTEQNPVHEYTAAGDYDVTLTVTDSENQVSEPETKEGFVDVWFPAPEASFTADPKRGVAPLTVQFTDSSVGQNDIEKWNWSFGDGTYSDEQNPLHTYDDVGDYDVTLTVTDSDGLSDSESMPDLIDAHFVAPTVHFSADPAEGAPPLTVQFTDNTVSDNGIEFWNWSFGDGTWFNTTNDWERSPEHTYENSGDYTVSLYVTDYEDQTAFLTADEFIDVWFPAPEAEFEANMTAGVEPFAVQFTDKSVTQDEIVAWNWSFGDGTYSEEANPVHIFLTDEDFTVALTVTDGDGQMDTVTKEEYISVSDAAPIAVFTFDPAEPKVNEEITFDASASYDPDPIDPEPIVSYSWDFGDGDTATGAIVTHDFDANQVYNVTLTVMNDDGTYGSSTQQVIVWTEEADLATAIDGVTLNLPEGHLQQDVTVDTDVTAGSVSTTTTGDLTTIVMESPSETWSNVTYVTEEFNDVDGVYYGDLVEAIMTSETQTTDLSDNVGDVQTQVQLDLARVPDGEFEMSVVEGVPTDVMTNGFQVAALNDHLAIDSVAYTIHFEDTENFNANLSPDGFGVNLKLSVSSAWVEANGGRDNIKIIRYSDDGLTQEVLETHYLETVDGMDFFTANSPRGLSYIGAAGTHGNPITSSFTAVPMEGFAPLNVQFNDNSVGVGINQWSWNFGDGTNSLAQNPSHSFADVGSYVVELTVTNTLGNWSTSHETIMVSQPPAYASFTAVPESGDAPLAVMFTDTSTSYSGTIVSRNWSFGDGTYSEAQTIEHTYAMPGVYTATLEVTNSYDNTNSTSKDITVTLPVVTAAFNAVPQSGDAPLNVTFTDLSTGSGINSWSWTFGDGSTSMEQSPFHEYAMPGTYTASLTVGTSFGNSSTASQDITVTLPVVTAAFNAVPQSGDAPLNVTFTDVSTGAGITSWSWTFGDGSTSMEQSPFHEYAMPGTYTASLTVGTSFGNTSTASQDIVVTLPAVQADFNAVPMSGDAPLSVTFTDASTGTGINSWSWDFGDGNTSMDPSPVHEYAMPGTYTANLTVGTIFGSSSSTTKDITVTMPVVLADFNAAPMSGDAPLNVSFTDMSTGAGITSWHWDFGDNTNSTEQNTQHTYRIPGNYTVMLMVHTMFGNMAETQKIIEVSTPAGASGTGTQLTPEISTGSVTTFDFASQAGTVLDITPSSDISAGNFVTVTEYAAPPMVGMPASMPTYTVLGKYVTIDSPLLEGNVSTMIIKISYDPAALPAGVAEADLVIQYYNPTTGLWEALPGAHGVDTTAHYVWATSTHLSTYGAFAAPAPVAPSGGTPASTGGSSGGGGGGGGGSSGGFFGRPAGALATAQTGQLGPSAASVETAVAGTGPVSISPLSADLTDMPGVSSMWSAQITSDPGQGAKITTAIQQAPNQQTLDAFRFALGKIGQDIASIAYVMVVQKTGFSATGPAEVKMTVPQDWVTKNGGTNAITIVRMADDGTSEVLATSFTGYDRETGYLTFTAQSPNGLCSFGLVAQKALAPSATPTSGMMAPTQSPAPSTTAKTSTGLPLMGIAGVVAALAIISVALLVFARKRK